MIYEVSVDRVKAWDFLAFVWISPKVSSRAVLENAMLTSHLLSCRFGIVKFPFQRVPFQIDTEITEAVVLERADASVCHASKSVFRPCAKEPSNRLAVLQSTRGRSIFVKGGGDVVKGHTLGKVTHCEQSAGTLLPIEYFYQAFVLRPRLFETPVTIVAVSD